MSPSSIDRRTLIAAGAAAALAGPLKAGAVVPADLLDALARTKGLRVGAAVGGGAVPLKNSFADPAYRRLVIAECGLMVPENELKWGAVRPSADRFDFARADSLIGWAKAHGLGIRGHTLLWNHPRWMPAWVATHDFGANPRAAAERMLVEHVTTVVTRYAGDIHSFDVVNEGIDDKTGLLRETGLSRPIGAIETIDLAFRAARDAAPHAQLVYNDYMSWDAQSALHRAAVLKLLAELKRRGTPIDALGVQGHLGTGDAGAATGLTRQEEEWRRFLDEVTGMGLRLLVTEFDINDKGLPADIAVRDRAVADLGRSYLDLMLSYRQLDTLMCWGLSDRYSWLQSTSPRADGLPKRPCPFDAAMRAKPLRGAIADAIRAAPARMG